MERRQSKAEEAIEKKLFETLDNFQSYEKISTEIDTLKEVWIFDDDIVATGHKLVGYQNEAAKLDDRIREINYNLEQYQESATRSFWSGNGSSFWSIVAEVGNYEKELKSLKKQKEQNDSIQSVIRTDLDNLCLAFEEPKETYWHATHKFRYSKNGQDSKIYTLHFAFDPDVKEILANWEENDPRIMQLMDLLRISFSIPGEEEFIDAVTEDEEIG